VSPKKKFIWVTGLCVIVAAAVPLIASARRAYSVPTKPSPAAAAIPAAAVIEEVHESTELQEQRDPQALVLELRPFGFVTPELTVAPGRYLIALENRTRLRDLSFQLDREPGSRVETPRQQRRDWRAQVVLFPGNYVITEPNHPEWRCVIRVTDR
jgi:hypothetical protein